MITTPSGELPIGGQELQHASPRLDTARAVMSQRQSGPTVVTLPEAIDITNDGQVEDMLARALEDETTVLVADASGTAFCGCSGVAALLRAHHCGAAAGTPLRVVVASPGMRRILELTGADHVLDTYPTLAAALAGRPGLGPGHGKAPFDANGDRNPMRDKTMRDKILAPGHDLTA